MQLTFHFTLLSPLKDIKRTEITKQGEYKFKTLNEKVLEQKRVKTPICVMASSIIGTLSDLPESHNTAASVRCQFSTTHISERPYEVQRIFIQHALDLGLNP